MDQGGRGVAWLVMKWMNLEERRWGESQQNGSHCLAQSDIDAILGGDPRTEPDSAWTAEVLVRRPDDCAAGSDDAVVPGHDAAPGEGNRPRHCGGYLVGIRRGTSLGD